MHRLYENLANAIVIQAAKDYMKALVVLKKNNNNVKSKSIKEEVEGFFASSWFKELTDLDSAFLMRKIREDVYEGKGVS